jgi:hypothetical protein
MLIAQQKRKENIAEYLLYMWQTEDQIRAFKLDIESIQKHIIDKYKQPAEVKKQIREWYENLILLMQNEHIEEKGHLQVTKNIVSDLVNTHYYLLKVPTEVEYQSLYFSSRPELDFVVKKTDAENEIEGCFTFLYLALIIRIKGEDIPAEALQALQTISRLVGTLAKKYHDLESGKTEFLL